MRDSGSSFFPSPEGKGRDHHDTPMINHQQLTNIIQQPSEILPHALLRMEKVVITEDISLRCLCCDGSSLDYRDDIKMSGRMIKISFER